MASTQERTGVVVRYEASLETRLTGPRAKKLVGGWVRALSECALMGALSECALVDAFCECALVGALSACALNEKKVIPTIMNNDLNIIYSLIFPIPNRHSVK